MSNNIRTVLGPEAPLHECEATKQNDILTFTCPVCGYVRHWDHTTGEMQVTNPGDVTALHRGLYNGIGIRSEKLN